MERTKINYVLNLKKVSKIQMNQYYTDNILTREINIIK